MSANTLPVLLSYSMLILLASAIPAQASSLCNPVVEPASSDTTLVRTLTRLAEEYDFKLSLPTSLDRPVQINKSMSLNKLVKYLTSDLNTVLKSKKINGCSTSILTHIIVLPVGKETDYVSVTQPAADQTDDYIYIENMDLYVSNVLSGKQKADLARMTPEQREEFNIVRETLRAQQTDQSTEVEETNQPGVASAINSQSNSGGN